MQKNWWLINGLVLLALNASILAVNLNRGHFVAGAVNVGMIVVFTIVVLKEVRQ